VADLVEHLESFLGPINRGARGDRSTPAGVQVVWFADDAPFLGVTTIVTLGLSHHRLFQPGGNDLRQELMLHLPTADQPANAVGVLFQLAGELIDGHRGLLRGELVGPRGRLFAGAEMTALYATAPVYLPDEFAVCDSPTGPIVLTWLVPITDAEAHYLDTHGWPALEAAFQAENPDLTDLTRTSINTAATHQRPDRRPDLPPTEPHRA
jgi:hypothetical protein